MNTLLLVYGFMSFTIAWSCATIIIIKIQNILEAPQNFLMHSLYRQPFSQSPSLATNDIFSFLVLLSLPEYHINAIRQYIAF